MLLLLLGCATWFDKGTSCDYKAIYTWSDDVLAHVLTGEGDGSFDYDPIDDPRDRLAGSYDVSSGDFSWEVWYDDDYFMVDTRVEGYGTAYHNGDLDLAYTQTDVDVLEETVETGYRVIRDGCSAEIATWDAEDSSIEDAFVQTGEYESDGLFVWQAEVDGFLYTGTIDDDLRRTLEIVGDAENYEAWEDHDPSGTSESGWEGQCGDDLKCIVDRKTAFDGSYEEEWKIRSDGEDYGSGEGEFDYDGSGKITYKFDETECVYTFKSSGKCNYECDDGSEGAC